MCSKIAYCSVLVCQTTVFTGQVCKWLSSPKCIVIRCDCYSKPASGHLPWRHPSRFAHDPCNCGSDVPAQQRKQSAIFTAAWAPLILKRFICWWIHSLPTSKVWQKGFIFFQIPLNAGIKECCKSWKCRKSHYSEALIHASSCLPPLLRLYHRELDRGKGETWATLHGIMIFLHVLSVRGAGGGWK